MRIMNKNNNKIKVHLYFLTNNNINKNLNDN